MAIGQPKPGRIWTVAQAKARLCEILRLAEEEGPQHIGKRKSFIVVPAQLWADRSSPHKPLGQWLVENVPRGLNLEIPREREPGQKIPFTDEVAD